jgi:hypothetical protein
MKITFTYEITTQESAANGDVEERGFYDPKTGSKFELYADGDSYKPFDGGLVSALEEASKLGCSEPNTWLRPGTSRFWISTADEHKDWRTGEETTYSVFF